jgi:hypothetical protein
LKYPHLAKEIEFSAISQNSTAMYRGLVAGVPPGSVLFGLSLVRLAFSPNGKSSKMIRDMAIIG